MKRKPRNNASKFNVQNTNNIEWAKFSWNPVTGCLHNCKYCYARDIAERFYPEKFKPTFHPERLQAPFNTSIPKDRQNETGISNVFLGSMTDLFGDFIPREWIDKVFDIVHQSRQWNYIVLTKNPKRLMGFEFPPNVWVGTTVDIQARVKPAEDAFRHVKASVKFLSCEPMLERLTFSELDIFNWIIVGGRSKNSRMPEFQPQREWVENLTLQARRAGCKLYFKPNLRIPDLKVILKEYPE